jgi:hypothetical protein
MIDAVMFGDQREWFDIPLTLTSKGERIAIFIDRDRQVPLKSGIAVSSLDHLIGEREA